MTSINVRLCAWRALFCLPLTLAVQACVIAPDERVGTTRAEVVEGTLAQTCEWPSVGVILPSACSAVLIHRSAIATATHCLYGADGRLEAPTSVVFGEQKAAAMAERAVETCYLRPAKDGDFAVCVLREPAPDIPIIPLMAACEDAWLSPGQRAVEVGFGDRNVDGPRQTGTKSSLAVYVVRARTGEPYLQVSSGTQAGEYYGDSGGPLFITMPDGTWRVAGIDSGSAAIVAGSTAPRFSVYGNVATSVDWAENACGLDLTPCHNGQRWYTGPGCVSLPSGTASSVSTSWGNSCRSDSVATPEATCEADEMPVARPIRVTGGCGIPIGAPLRAPWAVLLALCVPGWQRMRMRRLFARSARRLRRQSRRHSGPT